MLCGSPSFEQVCTICREKPLPLKQIFSLFWYTQQAELALKAYKYRNKFSLARVFGEMLYQRLTQIPGLIEMFDVDCIIPIPATNDALKQRGFHHTALIAHHLCKKTAISLETRALRSTSHKTPQASLRTPQERWENILDAYHFSPHFVKNKRVLLLDDVLTSGASLCMASRGLLAGGAKSVNAITLCRARSFQKYRSEIPREFLLA